MIVADPHMPHGERTKLLDFGIAKFTASAEQSNLRTQLSAVMGSPSYMSPEQCRGAAQVDDRTDVYSLGCMLYEMLSGKPPFMGDSMADLMARHQIEPPVPLAKRTAGVPPPLLTLVDAMLIKDRAVRPAMSQVLEGLETLRELLPQIAQRRSARMPTLRPPVEAVPSRSISTLGESVGQGLQRLQPNRRSWTITILAALITLALLTPLILGSHLGFQRSRSSTDVKIVPPPIPATPDPAPPNQNPDAATAVDETPPEHHHRHSGHSETKHNGVSTRKRKTAPSPPASSQSSPQHHLILVE